MNIKFFGLASVLAISLGVVGVDSLALIVDTAIPYAQNLLPKDIENIVDSFSTIPEDLRAHTISVVHKN